MTYDYPYKQPTYYMNDSKQSTIQIFFCGDFCSTPSTKPITVSEELKQVINSCDIKVCNFEVPLKPDGVKPQRADTGKATTPPLFWRASVSTFFPLPTTMPLTMDWRVIKRQWRLSKSLLSALVHTRMHTR